MGKILWLYQLNECQEKDESTYVYLHKILLRAKVTGIKWINLTAFPQVCLILGLHCQTINSAVLN